MSYSFSVFRKLKVNASSLLVNLELIIDVVFCANVKSIMAWKDLKLSIISKYLLVVPLAFNLFIKTCNFFAILINIACINVQLVNITNRCRKALEVE